MADKTSPQHPIPQRNIGLFQLAATRSSSLCSPSAISHQSNPAHAQVNMIFQNIELPSGKANPTDRQRTATTMRRRRRRRCRPSCADQWRCGVVSELRVSRVVVGGVGVGVGVGLLPAPSTSVRSLWPLPPLPSLSVGWTHWRPVEYEERESGLGSQLIGVVI